MEPYIQDWLTILDQMKNTNSYKLAFGLGVLECVGSRKYHEQADGKLDVSLEDVADCMIRYYWNQSFYFDLKQQPDRRVPVVYQETQKLIDRYKELKNTNIPVWSDQGLIFLRTADPDLVASCRKRAARILPQDVAWRLKNATDGTKELYEFDKKKDESLHFTKQQVDLLIEYNTVLSKLFSYKWALLLEQWNESPRLLNKVMGASNKTPIERKTSLAKYRNVLLEEFENGPILDFYTDLPIDEEDVSIDHVIPWSYIYSDDIWNLVVTTKSHNSIKGNKTPDKKWIDKLKERNKKLVKVVEGTKYEQDLVEAEASDLVDRYYFGLSRSYL